MESSTDAGRRLELEPRDGASGDAWAAGLGAQKRQPPPPPVQADAAPPAPPLTPLSSPRPDGGPRGWRKFFAIAGIVFGFTVLLTIPGWIALNTYREWERGQRGEPKLLIGWGLIASLLYSSAFLGVLAYKTTHEPPHEVAITTPGPPTTLQRGFESSSQVNGWTRYTNEAEGFSFSLPPKWSPDLSDTNHVFIARDWDSHLPAGNAFAIRLVRKAKSGGQTSVTLVGFFNATSAYTMTFLVPVKHANSYRSEFNDTARTFRLVE